jgi:TolB-like protein
MSNGPDDDYFTDGLTEEIINALAQLPELLVTARTSAFHFKGQNLPVEDIAGQLGVQHIVEGSVRRAGEQLRISAQLVRAGDGFHLWSETYDRRTEDTIAVQTDIAEKVAAALNVSLDESQRARMRRAGARNEEAYTAYQKGLEYTEKAQGQDIDISLLRLGNAYFREAFTLAPGFSDAYLEHSSLFSHILINQANGQLEGNITPADVEQAPAALKSDYDQAIEHAKNEGQRRASEYDRALLSGQWHGLALLSERALTAPGCELSRWSQLASAAFGQARQFHHALERLALCDPLTARPWIHLVRANLWLAQPERAVRIAESRLQSTSHQWLTVAYIMALAASGRMDQAGQVSAGDLRKGSERLISGGMLAALRGDDRTAAEFQEDFLGKYGPDDFVSLMLEAARGKRNEANRLASLIDRRPYGHITLMQTIYLCTCGAPFDLEATPVFAQMLAGSGLPWPPAKPINFPLKEW